MNNLIMKEYKKHWTITVNEVGLTVKYEVEKELCPTIEELIKYLKDNKIVK